jgi:hypothetical protein
MRAGSERARRADLGQGVGWQRDLTLDLCAAPAMPALSTPRSLDLAHLQTARWFPGVAPLDRFVTLDADQEAAARELGLPVAPAADDAGD